MIVKLKLNQGQVLTKEKIRKSLTKAKSTYDYCRIDMKHGIYITIAFFRDNTYDIMTNCRNIGLWNEINNARRLRSVTGLTDYVFSWIQVYNR